MSNQIRSFGEIARQLARNPLGIIALFIVLVYGLASLVTINAGNLAFAERLPLIYFLILFPGLVLGVFIWLVIRHSEKLYSPSDFKNEKNFMKLWAAASIGGAAANPGTKKARTDINMREIAEFIQNANTAHVEHIAILRNKVLWVDDNPENNIYVREAFEAMGLQITLALSTEEAFEKLSESRYGTIISDMKRREGPREGYVLLDRLRNNGDRTPLFFYSSGVEPEHRRETLEHDGQGCTDDPQELFEMVIVAIGPGALDIDT